MIPQAPDHSRNLESTQPHPTKCPVTKKMQTFHTFGTPHTTNSLPSHCQRQTFSCAPFTRRIFSLRVAFLHFSAPKSCSVFPYISHSTFLCIAETQRNAERRSKMQNSAFSVKERTASWGLFFFHRSLLSAVFLCVSLCFSVFLCIALHNSQQNTAKVRALRFCLIEKHRTLCIHLTQRSAESRCRA